MNDESFFLHGKGMINGSSTHITSYHIECVYYATVSCMFVRYHHSIVCDTCQRLISVSDQLSTEGATLRAGAVPANDPTDTEKCTVRVRTSLFRNKLFCRKIEEESPDDPGLSSLYIIIATRSTCTL